MPDSSSRGPANEAHWLAPIEWTSVVAIAVSLLTAPWAGHVDEEDTQLYQVIVRNIAAGKGWLDLRFTPAFLDHFREHLPFGFWPAAAASRFLGESAVEVTSLLWSVATLVLVGWTATRLSGRWAGLVAVLFLGLAEPFWRYGGQMRLDPPLLFLGMASAVPMLFERIDRAGWGMACLAAAAATLVKGPFGLLALPCAALAGAVVYRQPRRMVWGVVCTVLAALPATSFLLWDRGWGGGSWWSGYLQEQILASATGRRTDGFLHWWYPFQVIARRFWPGLPFALWGAWRGLPIREGGRRDTNARVVSLFVALVLVGLCLPRRKWFNHELLAFPPLALLGGLGAGPWIEGWINSAPRRERGVAVSIAGVALIMVLGSVVGFGRRLVARPCVVASELSHNFDLVPAGSDVLVVAPQPEGEWPMITSLAAERRLSPWPLRTLGDGSGPRDAKIAVVREGLPVPAPWQPRQTARGWIFAVRP